VPAFHLYDDAAARAFEPFALTRPAGELRAGALLVRERWARVLGATPGGFVGADHLADFEELDAPPAATEVLPAGAILVNARCAPALAEGPADVAVWRCGGRVAAVRLRAPVEVAQLRDGAPTLDTLVPAGATEGELAGWWMDAPWDYVSQLGPMLTADIAALGPALNAQSHAGTVLGTHPVYVEEGATIEPHVVFDTALGPVLVRAGATVQAFTRAVGPLYVGPHSTIMADRIAGCSIGEWCRVHGEISASVVVGHANKSHDGFVGHSYLSRWVNLGAGTTTSNLKNTYGTVALWTPAGIRDTGLQFLGTLFGDHAKTGIGLRLTTGCVIGAGANVYDTMPPKAVAPFAWGGGAPYGRYDVDKFVDVAARAMARRQVVLGDRGRASLRAAHARGSTLRVDVGRER
jgi:UDP-N-acetylglucosamine diphosphorylase/glucosamine-1-phosphate N-acetyltransferase